MGVHTKLQSQIQTEIQNRIQQTKQVIKASVPPKLMERADQVLLGLSHTGQSIPNLLKQTFKKIEGNPNDVIGRLSRTVIEHAQSVRATLTKPSVSKPILAMKKAPRKKATTKVSKQASDSAAASAKPTRRKSAKK